jgi:3',5'-cyclic AMP phosphodiesterase CpdA
MMMTSFAHISDLHIAPLPHVSFGQLCNKRVLGYLSWQCKRKRRHRREILEALYGDLAKQGPDYYLVNGDLTNLGLEHEFAESINWLNRLSADQERVLLVPGNHDAYVGESEQFIHDYWTRWFARKEHFPWAKEIGGSIVIIGVSSAVATAPFMATGRIGDNQAAALAGLLDHYGREGSTRLIMIHHPPVPGVVPARKGLDDCRALHHVVAESGAEAILHGHAHYPSRTHLVAGPRDIPVIGAGSASLASTKAGYGAHYHMLHLEARHLSIRHRIYDPPQQKFVAGAREEIDLRAVNMISKFS